MKCMAKRLNILLIEDNENDALLVIRQLEKSEYAIHVIRVETADEMSSALAVSNFDIVLSDYSLPQFNAMKALQILQSSGKDIPFIVSSGTIGEETAVQMMKAGAQDYIMKDNLTRLVPAIERELSDAQTRRDHKLSEQIQKVLYNISNAVVSDGSFHDLMVVIRQELGTLVDTTNFYIAFYDENTGLLSSPYGEDKNDFLPTWPAKGSLTGMVISQNKPLLTKKDLTLESHERGELELIGTTAECWLGVPLREGERVTGAFVVQSYDNPNAYSLRDVEILEFISHQLSLAIQRKKSETNLQAALVKAQESDRMKSAFLANISHEIRTPMNAIIGFSGMLNDADTDNEIRENFTKIINDNCQQLLSIIDDLVDISKIEIGEISLDYSDVCLNSLMDALFHTYAVKAEKKGLVLFVSKGLNESESCVKADLGKLRQVMDNLLTNAWKFTSEGSIDFGYQLVNDHLEFFVKDTGIGIPPEYHESIFERFMKVEKHMFSIYRGTGLGLAISKAFVNTFGGDIHVISAPEKGSEFIFTMPYQPVKSLNRTVINKGILPTDYSGNTILIVEDEEDNFKFLEIILKKSNLNILHAWDGNEAIKMAMDHPEVSLILMDFKLPDLTGEEVTRRILSQRPEVKVVAQTAYAFSKDKEKARLAGCVDYITKPIKKDNLYSALNKYLYSS